MLPEGGNDPWDSVLTRLLHKLDSREKVLPLSGGKVSAGGGTGRVQRVSEGDVAGRGERDLPYTVPRLPHGDLRSPGGSWGV